MEGDSDKLNTYIRAIQESIDRLSDGALRIFYDAVSDSLYIDFDEKAPFTVNDYLAGGWMVRLDPGTSVVRGLHIENAPAVESEQFP